MKFEASTPESPGLDGSRLIGIGLGPFGADLVAGWRRIEGADLVVGWRRIEGADLVAGFKWLLTLATGVCKVQILKA